MTQNGTFIAVDWGTSRLRADLYELQDGVAEVLASTTGCGVRDSRMRSQQVLLDAIEPHNRRLEHSPLVLLAGMVTSNIGWYPLECVPCPIALESILDACAEKSLEGQATVAIRGLRCTNYLGAPDFMRGEELQLLGWYKARQRTGANLLCLPGTHTKWVHVADGVVDVFQTSVTGELFDLLGRHSVLLTLDQQSASTVPEFQLTAFIAGVRKVLETGADISHLLFSARGQMLAQQMTAEKVRDYFAGLLVGADVREARRTVMAHGAQVTIIGNERLTRQFSLAMREFSIEHEAFSASAAKREGFLSLYRKHAGQDAA